MNSYFLSVLLASLLVVGFGDIEFRTVKTNGNGPIPRGTTDVTRISDCTALLFGGLLNNQTSGINLFLNDTWYFTKTSRDSGFWTEIKPLTVPSSRSFPGLATVQAADGRKYACMFGGTASFFAITTIDKFYCFNVSSQDWIDYTSLGGPSVRSGVTTVSKGADFFAFGGVDQTFTTHNDIWKFNIDSLTWTNLSSSVVNPPPRHIGNGVILCDEDHEDDCSFILYGGESITFTPPSPVPVIAHVNDTWQFKLSTYIWTDVTDSNHIPVPPRNNEECFIANKHQRQAFLFGGDKPGTLPNCTDTENPTNEMWKFKLSNLRWNDVATTNTPLPVKRHACVMLENEDSDDIFNIGGYTKDCVGGDDVQTFITTVTSFSP